MRFDGRVFPESEGSDACGANGKSYPLEVQGEGQMSVRALMNTASVRAWPEIAITKCKVRDRLRLIFLCNLTRLFRAILRRG